MTLLPCEVRNHVTLHPSSVISETTRYLLDDVLYSYHEATVASSRQTVVALDYSIQYAGG